MRSVAVFVVLLVAVLPALASHDKSDVVTTKDGATYIGEIKSVLYATLNLKTSPAGTIAIEWRYVTGLTSKFEYRIETTGGIRHYGKLDPPEQPGHLRIVSSDGAIEVALADVVGIVPIEHGFFRRLSGSVNFGLSYTQANEAIQYNFSGDASYRSRRNFATATGQSIFNTQEGGESTSQHTLTLVAVQLGKKRWGGFEIGEISANPAQGYDLRTILGGGATNFLIETSRKLLSFNLGPVYNREEVTDSDDVNQSMEALVGAGFRRFKRGSHSPAIQLSLTTFTSITDSPRFRAVLNFNIDWKVVGDLKFSFQVLNNYDSNPPGEDANSNNLSLVTSVGYTF
jgi:hypothetical protein